MDETIAFLLTMAVLILMTWLMARQGKLAPLPIQFKDPRLEALIALIPTALLLGFVARYWILRSPAVEVNPLAEGFNYTFGDAVNQLALSVIVLLPFVIAMGLRKQEWDTMGLSRRNLLPALFIGAVASLVRLWSIVGFRRHTGLLAEPCSNCLDSCSLDSVRKRSCSVTNCFKSKLTRLF